MAVEDEDLEFLKKVLPFWSKISSAQQEALREACLPLAYSAGSQMHRGSEDCIGLFVIKSGQVRTYILSDSGKEITLTRLFRGDVCIFSASCMMKNIRFDVFIEAVQPSSVLLIPTAVYEELNQSSLAVSDYTNQLLSSGFSDAMWVMEQVLFMSFDRRLALFLLEQSAIDSGDTLSVTHEEIANHMGTAREVVTRMLRYFQQEGLVRLSRGKIGITDRKGLSRLAR